MNTFLKKWGIRLAGAALTWLVPQTSFATLSNISATNDATNVYYSYNFTGTPTFLRIYLDTDKVASTGYSIKGIGANYLIENGNLYRYSGAGGTSWGWSAVGSSNMTKGSGNVKFFVARSSLGSPSAINLIANADSADFSAIVSQSLSSVSSPTPTPTPTPSSVTWTRCAAEGGVCSFSGTRQVRYGANGIYAYKTATSSIACDNATFGDPVVGVAKACDYSSQVITSPTPTPTPVSSPSPTPVSSPTPSSTPTGSLTQKSYSVSSAIIPNPERGFYKQTYCNGAALDVNTLKGYRANSATTVMRCYWYLKEFKTSLISQAKLDLFQQNMDALRAAGFKTVLRFAYDDNTNVDASPSMVQQHLNQLAPYLQRNADVISTMEAGFIGQWGEWADSTNFGSWNNWTSQNWIDRKAVVDRLLQILPADHMIQLRTPAYKTRMFGTAALTSAEAFTSLAKARVGHHNDCFLASANDWGTYTNTSVEYPYLAQETQFLPMGGETCNVNAPRTSCATAMDEMAKFHWSQLHDGYKIEVINGWKTEGCFPTINAKLGYRFVLQSGSFSSSAAVGGAISVNLNIQNQGYAAPFSPRKVELVLRNTSTGAVYRLPINSDPRRWLPGAAINVSQTLTLPAGMPSGNYALLLNLGDTNASLANRPEYAIQLANTGVWEASTGFNNLGANLVVQ